MDTWQQDRLLDIDGEKFCLPSFIRSVSSFESQLSVDAAIESLVLIPNSEPLLVSAYDFYLPSGASKDDYAGRSLLLDKLKELQARGCLVLLDSGKYEAARTGNLENWPGSSYMEILDLVPYTIAFCFDDLEPSSVLEDNISSVISSVENAGRNNIVPIVHAPVTEDGYRESESLPDIVYGVASSIECPLIAVAERELGDGLFQRMRSIQAIREKLSTLNRYQPLHVLGTGNPLSIALLAIAGADTFDGLEWCRTVVDRRTGHLYHHQQFDFFATQSLVQSGSGLVREAMADESLDYFLRMAIHNLDFYSDWMNELRENMMQGSEKAMLQFYLPYHIFELVQSKI